MLIMRKLSLIVAMFINLHLFAQTPARVIKVKDGDTYVLLMHGKQINCRLANVDAPELK